MTNSRDTAGFTLIELMLAMTFISILLVAVGTTSIFIASTYSKGLSLKEVNQMGRDIDDYLKRDIASSRPVDQYYVDPLAVGNDDAQKLGRLCLGNYSYLWTPANILNDASSSFHPLEYADGGSVIFARVVDSTGYWCKRVDGVYPTNVPDKAGAVLLLQTDTDVPTAITGNSTDAQISAVNSNYNLAIHEFKAIRLVVPAGTLPKASSLYQISFVIGTNEKDTVQGAIGTMDQTCKPPADADNDFTFCAVNQFDAIYYSGYQG